MIALLVVACSPDKGPIIVVHPVDEDGETLTSWTTSTGTDTTSPTSSTDTTSPTSSTETSTTSSTSSTTTSTETTDPGPVDPAIDAVDVVELDDVLEVHVQTDPGTAAIDGGTLLVELDGGGVVTLDIPTDLDSFVGGEAVFVLDRPTLGECTVGADHEVEVEVVDAAGRSSGPEVAAITTTDVGLPLDEIGDSLAEVLGVVPRGTKICGDLDFVANNGFDYTGDKDFASFKVQPTGDYTLELRWDVVGDWDLLLYEVDPYATYWYPLDEANGPDVHGPETMTVHLYKNTEYVFEAVGWDGDIGEWTIEIL